ncbi:hypothetical protein [Cytobacillus firmus]|uniref:hypothetical protein n=1 Tax=Cytobacillus firmus TaxID=1399 RepID=UPI00202EB084|nr:hypothetical protein [Cytobacillus firmus]URT71210.1 hypothetical protein NAF01_01580 [Cytobacillus firmus]
MTSNLQTENKEQAQDRYDSSKILSNLNSVMEGKTLEESVGTKYYRDVRECLDILDIEYKVTAVGTLGRALELCTKEYFETLIKTKSSFELNTGNKSIKKIREIFCGKNSKQDDRLKLLNQQPIKKDTLTYKLKRPLLNKRYYNLLDSIRDARNKAFHGCSNEEYEQLYKESDWLIEGGLRILIDLIKEIDTNNS